jgi:hypothetical protein
MDVAEGGEFAAIGAIEEKDAAAENFTLMDGMEGACGGQMLRRDFDFEAA